MIDTKVIFAIVGGVWLLLSEIMMSIRKKRNSKVEAYLTAKGSHRIAGIFESPEVRAPGKNSKPESEKVEFDLELEKGRRYSIAMYAHSPEERREYLKGDVPRDVLSIPLTLVKGSEDVKAYIIVYQDNVDEGGES